MRKLYGKKGFTLLELLVVISIIGILVAMGAVAYSQAQKKGRDARRVGDMKALQNAYEQYYSENSVYTNCTTMATSQGMSNLPVDPKGASHPSYRIFCDSGAYCACGQMEAGGGNANEPSTSSCSWNSSGNWFCVRNLQ